MERQRDMVFCHECENEWYRDEHGLTCPDCRSDFTEIIEADHDPRHTAEHDDVLAPLQNHNPWAHTPHSPDAPDPEESDVPNYQWRTNRPGGGISMSFSHTFSNNSRNAASPQPHAHAGPPDPMQTFATMLNSIMGGGGGGARQPPWPEPGRPSSSSSSQSPQSPDGQPNVRVFTGGGPNFHYTATTRLTPRDANGAQPHAQQIDDLPNMLNQMFGALPRGAGPDPQFAPLGLGGLFAGLFNPANMQHGDAVYSQEALDRIISQLMEQHQSGNAPGPASAEAIASLPQKTIAKEDLDETTGKADCSICMDEAAVGSQVTLLPCGHWFHGECIRAWLAEHDTCPHCREGIMPRDGPEDAGRPREPGQAPRNDHPWGQGEGTRADPINIPESPVQQRSTPNTGAGSGNGSSAGLFSRMRDAFGGGGSGSPSGAS